MKVHPEIFMKTKDGKKLVSGFRCQKRVKAKWQKPLPIQPSAFILYPFPLSKYREVNIPRPPLFYLLLTPPGV